MTSISEASKVSNTHLNDKSNYQVPSNYDLQKIIHEIRDGQGFYLLKNAFSKNDIKIARETVDYCTFNERIDHRTDKDNSALHSSYGGMKSGGLIFKLFDKNKIFEKFALHPAILEIARGILGPKTHISNVMSNTVLPGMDGQLPHLDYPYYDDYFPADEENVQRPLLSMTFMIMLSKFDIENGGTAFRPGSQKKPTYPHDRDEFYKNMVQLEGEPGDVGILAASVQHCAMKNTSNNPRVGIILSFVPVYVKPYLITKLPDEYMEKEASDDLKMILAHKHPYPMHINDDS